MEQGAVLPLLASHNTVHLRFDLEEADYLHLAKPDAAFPLQHFALATDAVKHQVPCQLRKVSTSAALRSGQHRLPIFEFMTVLSNSLEDCCL